MKILNEWFITAPWGKIALISWGTPNGPPALMVHGREDSAITFAPLMELLPDTYYYVGVDLPGHGRSDPLPKGVMLTRMHFVGTVEQVVQQFNWKKFIFIGHSMGTEQGLFYNAVYPHRITKFVLLDPAPALQRLQIHNLEEYYRNMYGNYYGNYSKFSEVKLYSKQKAVESVMKARGFTREQAELVLSRNMKKVGDDLYELSWDRRLKLPAPSNNLTDFYYKVFTQNTPPTLLISGKNSTGGYSKGKLATLKLISDMEKNLKNFTVINVEGGHDVHFTNPERFVKELCEFLDKKFECKSKL